MIIFYGGALTDYAFFGRPLSVLESFATIRKVSRGDWVHHYFLDSGAFSAWRKGVSIDLEAYCAFIRQFQSYIQVYANLDDIGNWEKSLLNYQVMLSVGLAPMPVYHEGEPFELLLEYAKTSQYIGLGALAMSGKAKRQVFLDKVFEAFPDPSVTGFHGFGVMDEDLILRYPWKSVDATSISMQARYGGIYFPGRGWVKINPEVNPKDLRWRTELTDEVLRTYVEGLGYSYEEAKRKDNIGTRTRSFISIRYYESLRERVPKYYQPTGQVIPLI